MTALTDVSVTRDAAGQYHLQWPQANAGQVTIYAIENNHPLADGEPVAQTATNSVVITGLPKDRRFYFYLEFANGRSGVAAERRLAFEKSPNFRDMGGYDAANSRHVKWGRLYRSGKLNKLSDQDVALMADLDIGVICDFRWHPEREREPTLLPILNAPHVAALGISPGSMESFFGELVHSSATPEDMASFMVALNRDLALCYAEQYQSMLKHMLSLENKQLLIHCAAGKDRTGFGAAVILSALGVSREDIMTDYLLSNQYLPIDREVESMIERYRDQFPQNFDPAVLRPMYEVRPEYLSAAFEEIDEKFDSVEEYLDRHLALSAKDLEKLRREFLYD
ncbi:MAG: tyrosine-protein phosphatase [Pseudomonadales bacterium]